MMKNLLDIRTFFDCDSDDYAEFVYQKVTNNPGFCGVSADISIIDIMAGMLFDILDCPVQSDGFAEYCAETAKQVVDGQYKNFLEVQEELDTILADEEENFDPDDEEDCCVKFA